MLQQEPWIAIGRRRDEFNPFHRIRPVKAPIRRYQRLEKKKVTRERERERCEEGREGKGIRFNGESPLYEERPKT